MLLAGVAVGQLGITVPATLPWAFFLLFLFSVGYKTGPLFFRSLGREAIAQAGLAVLLCVTGLAAAYAASRLFGFDVGTAAGVLAGSLNYAGTVGTATDAIQKLNVGEDARRALTGNLSVAFAVTYLIGMTTSILVLVPVGPWLMRIDLRSECKKLEVKLGIKENEPGIVSAHRQFTVRAYRVPESFENKNATELERLFQPERVFVERVKSTNGVVDANADTVLHAGDVLAVSGRSQVLASQNNLLRSYELDDQELLDIPTVIVNHILRRKDLIHRTFREMAEILENEAQTRGVFLRKASRAGVDLPLGLEVVFDRGDVLTLVGPKRHVDRLAERLGPMEGISPATNIALMAAAIAIGGLLGLPALHLGGGLHRSKSPRRRIARWVSRRLVAISSPCLWRDTGTSNLVAEFSGANRLSRNRRNWSRSRLGLWTPNFRGAACCVRVARLCHFKHRDDSRRSFPVKGTSRNPTRHLCRGRNLSDGTRGSPGSV